MHRGAAEAFKAGLLPFFPLPPGLLYLLGRSSPHVKDDSPHRFAPLGRDLPFGVSDYDAASETYVRWRKEGNREDRDTALHWAYLYALRYFYSRFKNERTSAASDLDKVVAQASRRIRRSLESVRDPQRFPQFVSVLCRRVLLSYRERRRDLTELPTDLTEPQPTLDLHDRALIRHLTARAFETLPKSVSEIARLRILEEVPYEDIAASTEHPIATVRTYVSRAYGHLRKDPGLRALRDEILDKKGRMKEQQSRLGPARTRV